MKFANPHFLFLCILPAAFAIFRWRSSRKSALSYSNIGLVLHASDWRTHFLWVPSTLLALGTMLAIVGLARPQWECTEIEIKSKGIAIELVVDVSSSMDMSVDFTSERMSRLDAAKRVIKDFVLGNGNTLSGRPNDLVGVEAFARYADTICPLTMGHDALVYVTDELKVNDRPNEDGTAFGDATSLAAARLKSLDDLGTDSPGSGVKSKIIILLTDGENNCGRHLPLEAAAMAKKWGIRLYTISLSEKPKVTNNDGRIDDDVVLTQTDRLLSRMAEMTGGIFRTAFDFESLQKVYDEIDKLEKTDVTTIPFTDYKEGCFAFILSAIVLTSLSVLLSQTILRNLS